jgi:hypothetical protein
MSGHELQQTLHTIKMELGSVTAFAEPAAIAVYTRTHARTYVPTCHLSYDMKNEATNR